MNNQSIWKDSVDIKDYPKLDKDIETNVLIVGGGVVGILCAYELKKRNIECVVVEKDKIGMGTSGDTTAFLTAQHETLYQDLIKEKGIEKAREYLSLNLKALDKYKELSKKYDFDYKECNTSLFSVYSKEVIEREKEALDKLNYKSQVINSLPIDLKIESGISFLNQATINPLKLIKELSKELTIYENTMINELHGNIAYTKDNYKIKFNHVIIATHYPFRNISGFYFAKLTQRRSYVVAFKHEDIKDTFCAIDGDGLYFRSYKDYLIVGGFDRDNKEVCKEEYYKRIKEIFKDKEIEYAWSGQDCISVDGIPYIGKYDRFHSNYYVATGFHLWGFTWAMASSFILSDLIEKKASYDLVSPRRSCLNKKLFSNIGNSLKHLITFKKPRCKHLGCALHYNKIEKVWECPCHGSRYDNEGNVLDGPTLKGIKKSIEK